MLNITKDGKTLSRKQMFILNVNGVNNISNFTYDECSEKIGKFVEDYKAYKEDRDECVCYDIDEHELWEVPWDYD